MLFNFQFRNLKCRKRGLGTCRAEQPRNFRALLQLHERGASLLDQLKKCVKEGNQEKRGGCAMCDEKGKNSRAAGGLIIDISLPFII